MALTTAANVRAMIKGSTSADDSLLTVLIGRAEVAIARYLGYPPASVGADPTIESASYTRRSGEPGVFIDPEDLTRLYLEPYPVTAISSVREDETLIFPASSEVASGDREQRGGKGQIIQLLPLSSHGEFSTARGAVRVAFTAGFTSVPVDIELAAIEYVAHLYNEMNRRGLASVSEGGLTTAYRDPGLPANVRELLSRYRLPSCYLHA